MIHRHLNHQELTAAAVDDIIARGKRADWEELRRAVLADGTLAEVIRKICAPHLSNMYAQRYHFWNYYVRERVT